jgi:tRNA threonylcarbamoyladenosine biosynthesis protein TsaE
MAEEFVIYSSSEEETIKIGEELGKLLKPGTIIGLNGELGTGKTVFVKGIARGLNTLEEPNSPTFVIMNKYEGRIPLYHFDLYRISSAEELEGIGYEDYFYGNGVTVVEWSDRVKGIFPEYTIKIEIKIPDKNVETQDFASLHMEKLHRREIIITGKQPWLSSFRNTVEQASQL